MPVGKGSIVRATNASSNHNSSVVKTVKRTPDIITEIPVGQIVQAPKSWMKSKTLNDTSKELVESIGKYGMIEPVILRRIGDNQFQLLSGNRRLLAIKELGLEMISSIIIEELNDKEAREIYGELHLTKKVEPLNLHEAKFEAVSKITNDMPVYLL